MHGNITPPPLGEELDNQVQHHAVESLFNLLEELCEGAITVDRDARISWINDKYRRLLGISDGEAVLGRPIEELIPSSQMRQVVETGKPIPLDIMQVHDQSLVVTRLPVRDAHGSVAGATGFVLYDKVDYLKPLIGKFAAMQQELTQTRKSLAAERRTRYTFSQCVGSSPAYAESKRQARRAAPLDASVLLLGETGTGKELLAQAIHAASPRADAPFVGVNLAAIPENLLEAEFFGVAPGAYTGAQKKARAGKFQVADGGTLFLDEIGDMPLHLQSKLLRALQEREIEPLGSNQVQQVDVRVIAATSRDMGQLVADGQFRADLYYRLNVLPIRIPPLRERLGDLPLLCEVLLEQIAQRSGTAPREILPEALPLLASYDWPGNVRELHNALERACALSDDPLLGHATFAATLPNSSKVDARNSHLPDAAEAEAEEPIRPLAEAIADAEVRSIRRALEVSGGVKVEAARLLGISRAKLYERLERYGLG
jgi:transcriptional regulator with PAS, ATPase and Fis domain